METIDQLTEMVSRLGLASSTDVSKLEANYVGDEPEEWEHELPIDFDAMMDGEVELADG